jgi:hypothetical protein
VFAWLKDKAFLLFAIAVELWRQRNEPYPPPSTPAIDEDNAAPLQPIIPPEGLAMRWREEAPTKPDVNPKPEPLRGSLADRVEKARRGNQ